MQTAPIPGDRRYQRARPAWSIGPVYHIDCASPNLMRYALKGTLISKAVLTMRKSGGVPLDFQRFTLEHVHITGVNPIGTNGTYIENVRLSFAKVKQEYILQNATGGNGGAIVAALDLRENREA